MKGKVTFCHNFVSTSLLGSNVTTAGGTTIEKLNHTSAGISLATGVSDSHKRVTLLIYSC